MLSFIDRIRQKSTINKTCCCVKLTNDQVVLPVILVIFMDGCDKSLDETKFRQRHVTVLKYDMIGFEIQTEDMHILRGHTGFLL